MPLQPVLALLTIVWVSLMALVKLKTDLTWIQRYLPFLKDKRAVDVSRNDIVAAVAGIQNYESVAKAVVTRRKKLYFRMTAAHQDEAINTYKRYNRVQALISENAVIMKALAKYAIDQYAISSMELACTTAAPGYSVLDIVNHYTRDYSTLSAQSRKELFEPVLARLKKSRPEHSKVLVPGAGVGALASEIAALGHAVDAVEFSATMHLAALFANQSKSYQLYPFLLDFSHLANASHQTLETTVQFHPSAARNYFADFLKFDKGYKYDAIVTLFFVDTAECVLDYVDRIETMLAPGGTWINYGPLKWGTAARVEFSMDELLSVLKARGWQIQDEFEGSNRYSGYPESMWDAQYRLKGWQAVLSGS